MQQGSTRTSDILVRLVGESATDRVSVRAIVDVLGERAYALLVVVLGLPNCLPMPPPIPLICGLLLLFVAAQIVLGKPSPWLPRRLLGAHHRAGGPAQGGDRAVPWLRPAGARGAPAPVGVREAIAFRLVGLACWLVLAGAGLRRAGHRPDPARPRGRASSGWGWWSATASWSSPASLRPRRH